MILRHTKYPMKPQYPKAKLTPGGKEVGDWLVLNGLLGNKEEREKQ